MNPEIKIMRHGYHLMSLASVGIACVAVWGLLLVCMPYLPNWNPQATSWATIAKVEWEQAVRMNAAGKAWLSLAYAIWTLAYLLPLFALRKLGRALFRSEALTTPVAKAFLWLAHSLPLNALLCFIAGMFIGIAAEVGGVEAHNFKLDIGGFYIFLIATLCLYSVAHLMRLASEAADDSRSIV